MIAVAHSAMLVIHHFTTASHHRRAKIAYHLHRINAILFLQHHTKTAKHRHR